MVSNGAYVLKEWVPNSHIRLQKNPQFHAAASVKIDVVRYEPTKDLSAAARRFMAGELQSTSDIPADQTKFLKEKLGDQVKISPYLGTWYLAVNTSKKPFDDVRVRQALSIAIDREFIAEEIWQGTMLPAYSFVPPGTGNYDKPATADYKDLSPIDREDKAKALLKEAGFGPGKPLKVELRYNTTDNNKNTAVAIANQWKAIGVETSFINTDAKTHFAYLRDGGDFDVARAGWIADYSDPQNFLFLVQSDNPGFNYAKYKNPDYDALDAQVRRGEGPRQARRDPARGREGVHARPALHPDPVLLEQEPRLLAARGLGAEPARRQRDAVPVAEAVSAAAVIPGRAEGASPGPIATGRCSFCSGGVYGFRVLASRAPE